jgi:hypothetical protein
MHDQDSRLQNYLLSFRLHGRMDLENIVAYLEYLVRAMMRMVQLLRSRSWPTVTAIVNFSSLSNNSFVCTLAS